jgi:spore coat protein U-like protein
VSAAGDVTVSCAAPYNIGLDAGQNLGQNPSNPNFRAVTNGTDYVKYELFQTAFNVDEWGNGGAGNYPFPPLNDTGTGTPQAHTVFGVIGGTSGQSTGQYSDVVNVTVAF